MVGAKIGISKTEDSQDTIPYQTILYLTILYGIMLYSTSVGGGGCMAEDGIELYMI